MSYTPCIDKHGDEIETYDWNFDKGWWYTALSLCIIFTIFPIYDFTINKSRNTPSKLMLGRIVSNFCLALVFLVTVKSDIDMCTKDITCHALGALFTIFLLISAAYYTTICFDLYFTLKNPFRKPASNSMWIHFIVIFAACIVTIPIGLARAFEYREDFQFCWTVYKEGFNLWNIFIIYVPASVVVIGGIVVTYWSLKHLQSRILDDTFELRWKIIKRQTGIVGCFTINYVCQAILWLLTFGEHSDTPTRRLPQPYVLSVFVLCGVFFDLITWCAKDSILMCWRSNKITTSSSSASNLYEDDTYTTTAIDSMNYLDDKPPVDVELRRPPYAAPNAGKEDTTRPVTARSKLLIEKYSESTKKKKSKSQKMSQNQNLSNALRREVITFITAGLVTGVKVTAWETNKKNDVNTYDDDFDGDDGFEGYGNNYREDTETHPALQLFRRHPTLPGPEPQPKDKDNYQHIPKANSYAGFFDRKPSKSPHDKRSTDSTGFSDRHHRGSSYYTAKIGRTSTVAVSIPIGLGLGHGYDMKERGTSLDSIHSEIDLDSDGKYNEYVVNKRRTLASTDTQMEAEISSSSNVTPDISQGSRSDESSPDIELSSPPPPLHAGNRVIGNIALEHTDMSSAMDSYNNSYLNHEDDDTMNAEDGTGGDWNETDQTLEFDVGGANNDTNIYSESLLATAESDPPITYYPQSIKLKKASTNRGTVNRFNIGIAGSDRVSFTDYAPHVFRYLRTEIYGVSDRSYLESVLPPKFHGEITRVSEDIIAKFSEGRSGAFFFFTPDNKYLIKTLMREEAQLLIDTLFDYVKYMKINGGKTYLTRYYGLHSVKLYSKVIYFMVSVNVFPADKELTDKIMERYDIKGSWINRHTNRHLFENKLMKDEDLHRNLQLDPVTQSIIHTQLTKDTAFLQKQHIMDYSLLLGISYERISTNHKNSTSLSQNQNNNFFNKKPYNFAGVDENSATNCVDKQKNNMDYTVKANIIEGPGTYYIGIIDMLQKWNNQKKGERFLKVYLRCKNHAGISCVEPAFYRKRFLKKMQKIGM